MIAAFSSWGNVSASAVLFFAIVLILTGRLTPRSNLKDEQKRGDEWREMFMESQKTVTELVSQVKDLTATSKSSETILKEIVDLNRRRQQHDADTGKVS